MFKKTLLAVTIAAMSTTAFAGTLVATPTSYSAEGLQVEVAAAANYTVNAPETVLTTGAAYPVGAKVTLTFSAGSIAPGYVFPTTLAGTLADATLVDDALISPNRLSADSVEYTIGAGKAIDLGGTLTIPIGNDALLGSFVAANDVKLTVTAVYSSGAVLDATKTLVQTLTSVKSQFATDLKASSTVLFDAKVDVSETRKKFDDALADSVKFTYSEYNALNLTSAVAPSKLTVILDADLTGFKVDKTTKVVSDVAVTSVTGFVVDSDGITYDEAKKQVTFSTTANDENSADFTFEITAPTGSDATELMVQDFAATVMYSYGTDKTASLGKLAAGSWTLNGSSVIFPYAPVGFDGIVKTNFEVANKGVVEGDITITAFDDEGVLHPEVTLSQKAEPGRVVAISDSNIVKAFGLTKGTKLRLTITVNSPNDDIAITGYTNRGEAGGRMALPFATVK